MNLYAMIELEQGDRVARAIGEEFIDRTVGRPPSVLFDPDPTYPFAPGEPENIHWTAWRRPREMRLV